MDNFNPLIKMKPEIDRENGYDLDHSQNKENIQNVATPIQHECPKQPAATKKATAIAPPKAYEYAEAYRSRREAALRQQEAQERSARLFHSRPVPNFKAIHNRLNHKTIVHRVTVPETPKTIKRYNEQKERRKLKEQQQLEQLNSNRRCLTELKPTQLNVDLREYDAAIQKKLQQEAERKKREIEAQQQQDEGVSSSSESV